MPTDATTPEAAETPTNFLREIVEQDIAQGKWGAPGDATVVRTRFPPEPNGYLHIGHAKSILLNFGLAKRYGGACNLRFDDTNPAKEEHEYVDSIIRDHRWLGVSWPGAERDTSRLPQEDGNTKGVLFASDYFETFYEWAQQLIRKGLAYVDEQSGEEIRKSRGTLKEPGTPSPHRDRPPEESIDLLERMKAGEFPDGSMVLRAKIDMASPNMNLRDPVMYRVLRAPHHRTGEAWKIYPMYDWAHGNEDSIEGITHSICTLEFEIHRPLYDWFLDNLDGVHHPQQIEFAKLKLTYTVMGKRKLRELVERRLVSGWDDPRMPTISAFRRRGYTPEAIRAFADEVGVTRFESLIDFGRLENALRADLNKRAPRRMGVLRPLKVTIENWADGEVDWLDAVNNPEDESAGTRQVPFSREIYIEQDDFMEDAPRKFFRLAPGREVRLRYAYFLTCTDVVKDESGQIIELKGTIDPATRGGDSPDGRKVKGTIHWVSAAHAVEAEVRLYDRLWSVEQAEREPKDAGEGWDWTSRLNPDSLEVIENARLEPAIEDGDGLNEPDWGDGIRRFQFERLGYFCVDPDAKAGAMVFNRAVSLKDSWAKAAKK